MRKTLIYIVSALICFGTACGSSSSAEEPAKEIKILYWNIQNGMWADQGNNYDKFVEFVRSVNPDICVWCEAQSRYRTGTAVKMTSKDNVYLPDNWDKLASRYGHSYSCISGKRDEFPQVVTARFPVKCVKRINGDGKEIIVVHGAGITEVDLGWDEPLKLVTVHTWPQKYAYNAVDQEADAAAQGGDVYRSQEMKYICENSLLCAGKDAGEHLWAMLGDFNAMSPVDNFYYCKDAEDKCFLTHKYILGNTPYIDLIQKFYPGKFYKSTLSGKRVDFVYVSPGLLPLVKSAKTIWEGFPDSYRIPGEDMHSFCDPSDHYPIVFVIGRDPNGAKTF